MTIIRRNQISPATVRYEVGGNIANLTDEQLINKCDPNNWGGKVLRTTTGAIVEVYID